MNQTERFQLPPGGVLALAMQMDKELQQKPVASAQLNTQRHCCWVCGEDVGEACHFVWSDVPLRVFGDNQPAIMGKVVCKPCHPGVVTKLRSGLHVAGHSSMPEANTTKAVRMVNMVRLMLGK